MWETLEGRRLIAPGRPGGGLRFVGVADLGFRGQLGVRSDVLHLLAAPEEPRHSVRGLQRSGKH